MGSGQEGQPYPHFIDKQEIFSRSPFTQHFLNKRWYQTDRVAWHERKDEILKNEDRILGEKLGEDWLGKVAMPIMISQDSHGVFNRDFGDETTMINVGDLFIIGFEIGEENIAKLANEVFNQATEMEFFDQRSVKSNKRRGIVYDACVGIMRAGAIFRQKPERDKDIQRAEILKRSPYTRRFLERTEMSPMIDTLNMKILDDLDSAVFLKTNSSNWTKVTVAPFYRLLESQGAYGQDMTKEERLYFAKILFLMGFEVGKGDCDLLSSDIVDKSVQLGIISSNLDPVNMNDVRSQCELFFKSGGELREKVSERKSELPGAFAELVEELDLSGI